MNKILYSYIETQIGQIIVGVYDNQICLFDFAHRRSISKILLQVQNHLGSEVVRANHPLIDKAKNQLASYLEGSLQKFTLPVVMAGSDYQQRVWTELLKIPYGQTRSYNHLAKKLKSSPRAVGRANGSNPIAIIVPCHRVIGEDGTLVGYGGGIPMKKKLLELESMHSPESLDNWFPSPQF